MSFLEGLFMITAIDVLKMPIVGSTRWLRSIVTMLAAILLSTMAFFISDIIPTYEPFGNLRLL